MAPKSRSSALQAQPPDATGSADENGDLNHAGEGSAGVSLLWILAIFVNILFVLLVFALLGYCLNKYKKRTQFVLIDFDWTIIFFSFLFFLIDWLCKPLACYAPLKITSRMMIKPKFVTKVFVCVGIA